jgi:hypothetical protein
MYTAQMSREVSASEMMSYVARAKMVERAQAEEITGFLRTLTPFQLVEEFHKSVAALGQRRLLSPTEEHRLGVYAQEFLRAS